MSNAIEVRNIVKKFKNTIALNNISIDIDKTQISAIIGPNGAGKTTLIQILIGLMTKTSGTVKILGMDIEKDRHLIARKINFSSNYLLLPYSLKVEECLNIFSYLYSIENKKKINEVLEMMEIDNLRKKLIASLSSGQLVRVLLAKSLLNSPEILFLDEPTASLDPEVAHKIRDELRRLSRTNGMTIFYSSQNMLEVENFADKVFFINKGKIIFEGTPKEILDKYQKKNFEEVFLEVVKSD